MVRVTYPADETPADLVLQPGDELHFYQRRRMAVAIWGTPDRAVDDLRKELLESFAREGHFFRASTMRAQWLDDSTFWADYEIEVVLVYDGPSDPEGYLYARMAWATFAQALILILAVGWVVHESKETVVELNKPGGAADAVSLFPIAAVLLGLIWLLGKKQ